MTKTLINLRLGLKIKVKEAVPNCLMSKETLVEEGPEAESIVSGDERSNEIVVSSPVIKVYGSTGVEARAFETELLKAADRINP